MAEVDEKIIEPVREAIEGFDKRQQEKEDNTVHVESKEDLEKYLKDNPVKEKTAAEKFRELTQDNPEKSVEGIHEDDVKKVNEEFSKAESIAKEEDQGFEEKFPFKVEFEEGPEDVTQLDVFLLNVSEEKIQDVEAAQSFMESMIQKEMDYVNGRIESAINEENDELLESAIKGEYFLRSVKESLDSGDYVNTKDSPVVNWFNAKRRFYKEKIKSSSEVSHPAYKDTIERLETIGQTLIIQK